MTGNKVKILGLRIDLHVHTCYSSDAVTTLKEVVTYSKKRGLDGVAITDHETVLGALKLSQQTKLIVIPGIEIASLEGHFLALNVTKPIPPNLPIQETVRRIHESGGIAVVTHPYSLVRSWPSQQAVAKAETCDAVEVINSASIPFSFSRYMNRKIANYLNLPEVAGSDSHYAPEIGAAYTIIDADPNVDEIVQAIRKGATIPLGDRIPWIVRFRRVALSLKRKMG